MTPLLPLCVLPERIREGGAAVLEILDPLRELNTLSVLLRMVLAMLFGGLIGLERGR